MPQLTARELIRMVRQAGYSVQTIEHLRTNRWLLIVRDAQIGVIALFVQSRALVTAADVQDLAEIVRVRGLQRGILLAYGGIFSATAQRTCTELDHRLQLCTTLPPAPSNENA